MIQDWTLTEVIDLDGWNLLEISARGSEFSIFLNHQPMLIFSDSRLESGAVAILIDIYGRTPGLIEIDWFALQLQ